MRHLSHLVQVLLCEYVAARMLEIQFDRFRPHAARGLIGFGVLQSVD